jgi:hypothetical protein
MTSPASKRRKPQKPKRRAPAEKEPRQPRTLAANYLHGDLRPSYHRLNFALSKANRPVSIIQLLPQQLQRCTVPRGRGGNAMISESPDGNQPPPLIIVTHDDRVAAECDRVINLPDPRSAIEPSEAQRDTAKRA